MNPIKKYRIQRQTNWTRIEMLISLYREAEVSIKNGVASLKNEDRAEFALSQIRSIKLLLAIIEGIRPDHDKLSRHIHQLCLFIFHQVTREEIDGLQNGLRVLVKLRESFESIEGEANLLEAEGGIPPLNFSLDGTLAVG